MANRDALIAALDELDGRLRDFRASLAAGAADEVSAWNASARADRDELLGAALVGGPVHELRASVPNRPGVIAEIALALGGGGVNIADMALSPSTDGSRGEIALWIAGEANAQRASELIGDLGFTVVQA